VNERLVSEIVQAIGSPAWWFSTVIVAIIANVVASFIYEFLKSKMKGRWGSVVMWSFYVISHALFIASFFTLPIRWDRAIYLAIGITLATVASLYEVYRVPGYGFGQNITVASVFALTFFDPEFPRALADRDLIWLGQQFFLCFGISLVVQALLTGIFYRRYFRKRRGLAK
jgi:hypothetical protein